jgi:hypothetical protein
MCPVDLAMKARGIEQKRKRTKYACFKLCKKSKQLALISCDYINKKQTLAKLAELILKTDTESIVMRCCTGR